MILNEFFNLPQVFEKDMNEGVMSEIDAELRNIVANEDFDALYELFTANTPAGKFVQDMYDDVVIDTGLHPDDDFERIEQIVFDRLADDFGEQGVAEGKEELHTQLQSINQKLKLMRGGPVGEPNSMAFVEKRKELLKQKEQILSQLKQGVAEAVWDRPSQSYVPRDGRTFGQTNHPREEHCDACGAATGHAGPGEDSNVDDEGNVYCDDCYADQKGVAEGYEPPTSAKGSPAYRASLLRKKQERQAAADAKKKQQGVAEGHADQQRKVFKKNGEPVGEVGIDRESSPGNGQWYMKYYPTGDDFSGYDSMEEAVADLKHLVNQFKAEGVAEGSYDDKGITHTRGSLVAKLEALPKGSDDFEWNRIQAIHHLKQGNMLRAKYYMALMKRGEQGVAEAAPSTELQDKMRQVRPKGKGITRTELQNAMRRKGKKQWHCPECATYDDNVHGKFCSKYKPKEQGVAEGEVTKTATGLKHRATDKYGAGNDEPHHYTGGRSGFSDPGKYARDLEHVNKQLVKDLDASMGISWKNRGTKGVEVDEAEQQKGADYRDPPEANYDDKYQAMVRRVGEKARAQEKARQQQQPKAPVRESRRALLKQIIQS